MPYIYTGTRKTNNKQPSKMSKKKKKKEMECRELTELEALAKELKLHKKSISSKMKKLDSFVQKLYDRIYRTLLIVDEITGVKDDLDQSVSRLISVIDPKNKKDH